MSLVLTRKAKETIEIGDNITITIYKTTRSGAKIAIDAPKDVKILRGEIDAKEPRNAKADR